MKNNLSTEETAKRVAETVRDYLYYFHNGTNPGPKLEIWIQDTLDEIKWSN